MRSGNKRPWALATFFWKCQDRLWAAQLLSKVINAKKANRTVWHDDVLHEIEDLQGNVFLCLLWLLREDFWPDALAGQPFLEADEYAKGMDTCPPSCFPQSQTCNTKLGDVFSGGWTSRGPECCGYKHYPRTCVSQQPLGDLNGVFPTLDWDERPAPGHRHIKQGRHGAAVRGKAARIPVQDLALSHSDNVFVGFSHKQREALNPVRYLVPARTGAWQNTVQPTLHHNADGTVTVGGHNAGFGTRYRQSQDHRGNYIWSAGGPSR